MPTSQGFHIGDRRQVSELSECKESILSPIILIDDLPGYEVKVRRTQRRILRRDAGHRQGYIRRIYDNILVVCLSMHLFSLVQRCTE